MRSANNNDINQRQGGLHVFRTTARHAVARVARVRAMTALRRWRMAALKLVQWWAPEPPPREGLPERVGHHWTVFALALFVVFPFGFYNIYVEKMVGLGLAELVAAAFVILPGAFLARQPTRVAQAENLLLLGVSLVFGALLVFGGIEGTGIYWIFILPFLIFFVKDQRMGWLVSLSFLALASVYLIVVAPHVSFKYPHTPVVTSRFLLAFFLYTLIAAAFNLHRARFEGALVEGKKQAEAAVLAKSRFLAAASHDLRQPAHALGLFVGRLTQMQHGAETRQMVDGVDQAVRGLQQMLDDFFDYARLDAYAERPHTSRFAISNVLGRLEAGFGSQAADKGLRLRIRPSRHWVESDPIVLHRVLLNLVSNAVQYTPQGSVLVACRADTQRSRLRIEVWDSGMGIAPEHHEAIFSEFFQITNPERDRSKGIGLGLSIVQRSCQLLGHRVTLTSRLGQGSRFGVEVPLVSALSAVSHDPLSAAHDASAWTGLQVLVIEDDVLGGEALQGLLTAWGCQATLVRDANGALTQWQRGLRPDFIVSDYRLPGARNGVETVQLLRELAGAPIAACVVSGDTDEAVRNAANEAGLILLPKPVRPAKLRSMMRRLTPTRTEPSSVPELI